MSERLLRTPEVQARVGLGRTTIWRLERAGDFPRRRQIGVGTTGWLESEVNEWIRARPVAPGAVTSSDAG
jgi:prophage regulatory protein